MKYKLNYLKSKEETVGGAYWQGADFNEHLKLTGYQTTYQHFLQNNRASKKILEAGCGIGRWVIPLAKKKFDVTGIELEKEALRIIRHNCRSEKIPLVCGDIFHMPFTDKAYDIVISLGVLEHFETSDLQQAALKEHTRILKDDGILLITVPYISWIRILIHLPFLKLVSFVRILKNKKEYFSEYRYSRNAFESIISYANLKVVDIVYDDLIPPYNFGLMDYPVRKLFKNKKRPYILNQFGRLVHKFLWDIHPKLISGGIGFVCQKNDFTKTGAL